MTRAATVARSRSRARALARSAGRLLALALTGTLASGAFTGGALTVFTSRAEAQNPPPSRTDTSRRSTRDTSKVRRDTLQLAPPDSMMRALMARRGYEATRYQGDSVTFATQGSTLLLYGKPSIVLRAGTQVSGTWINFDDVLKRLLVFGAPGRIHDPAHGEDIVAYDTIRYDINERRGTAGRVETAANNGAIWCMSLGRAGFINDTAGGTLLGRNVSLTTDCTDNPHYHFLVGELKRVGKNTLVGSPAKLYIGEVPILWLPWFWQPEKKGRNSGVLTPRFGFAELLRNTPSYRRTVENVGYYFALSDYYDAQLSMDWRSGARPTLTDPGQVKLMGEFRYNWRSRFLQGRVGVSRLSLGDGVTNLQLLWQHRQSFSQRTSLTVNANYSANTSIQQQTTINPMAVTANIASQINYATHLGPFQTNIGGSQTQYLGRDLIDRSIPTVSISTSPIQVTPWLTWTPTLSSTTTQSLHLDSPSEFGFRRVVREDGTVDSVRNDRSTRSTSLNIGTPFKIGKFTISANANISDRLNDFPEAKLVVNPTDTSLKRIIVYARTYLTTLDWNLGVNLPGFSQGRWNLTPSVTLRNVDPGAFIVRSERSGSNFVTQSKRVSYGLSVSPTFFAITRPIGPFAAIRHSVNPQITYSFSPAASVSDAFLGALGRTRAGYLGALQQNRISLTLNQIIEAKFRGDTSAADAPPGQPGAERKIKLLSLQFTPIEYDFELAKATGRLGIATDRFGYTVASDLLPGLNFHVDYSLFDAPVISDTAHFSPYAESIGASLTLGRGGAGLGILGKLFAWATGEKPRARSDTGRGPGGQLPGTQPGVQAGLPPGDAIQGIQTPINGAGRSRPSLVDLPTGRGWSATVNFTSSHSRPVHGTNVIAVDPRATCEVFRAVNPIQYDICLRQAAPTNTDYSQSFTTAGGPVYRFPASTSVTSSINFSLTENWAAQWQTSYDVVRHEFASQTVSLQRDLKDWRASFGFQQAPNGNFAFNFLITLKPAPDVQFPYNQRSYRSTGAR